MFWGVATSWFHGMFLTDRKVAGGWYGSGGGHGGNHGGLKVDLGEPNKKCK
jgi:hypothetical protein